jgi:flagellar motor switch protein FliN/FliY
MERILEKFVKQWAEEFSQAVETFTGSRPAITAAAVDDARRSSFERQSPSYLWWRQEVRTGEAFVIRVGAPEACWLALGSAATAVADPKQAFFDMVAQANQSAIAMLSVALAKPLRCHEGAPETAVSLERCEATEIQIALKGDSLPELVLAVEADAERILGPGGPAVSEVTMAPYSPMMNRLMDLQLPVSVLLGRAVLTVREVLKLSSGSLIELDRQVGDYVEVMVHGTVVAKGEIVSVRGNYGVRIKEVISRQDRIALKDAA